MSRKKEQNASAAAIVRGLLDSQPSGVLGTYGDGKPYVSIMAFAVTADLKTIVMVTPRNTRKYANLLENGLGALLMDNRTETGGDRSKALAVTAEGIVVFPDQEHEGPWHKLFAAKHPALQPFLRDETTVLFGLAVQQYVLVRQLRDTEIYVP